MSNKDYREPSLVEGAPRCGLCGNAENLTKTECCGNWICDDEQEYKLFSFDRNSCYRNHRRYTLCGYHHAEEHDGDWQTCAKCRESREVEMVVYYGTNEYNFEVLSNPPEFEPTKCSGCGMIISLANDGYSIDGDQYYCEACTSRRFGGVDVLGQIAHDNTAASLSSEELIENKVKEVLRQLEEGSETLPLEALWKVQAAPHLFIGALIKSLEDATAAVAAGDEPIGETHFFALFLLAEFKERAAWPAILSAISLPGDGPFELFGDTVTECLSRILAVFLADQVDQLEELILNPELNEYVRWQGAHTFILWVRDGSMTREQAVSHLRKLLKRAMEMRDELVVSGLVCDLCDFADADSLPELRAAFDQKLVDTSIIDWRFIEETFAGGDDRYARTLQHCPPTGIPDTVSELSRWDSFKQSDSIVAHNNTQSTDRFSALDRLPELDDLSDWDDSATVRNQSLKVGRNEACPCGSGKKYKKCCGG